jgi:glutamate synthase domain-containing protein 2
MRKIFVMTSLAVVVILGIWSYFWIDVLFLFLVAGPIIIMGFIDMYQTKQSIRRNFPVLGRLRYVFEDMRPKIQQYFVENDTDGAPINRIDRSVIYQRAKKQIDTTPFGTQLNVYAEGYEWMSHSITPLDFHTLNHHPRVTIGNKDCQKPYESSILNVSAMSFGSLSANAIEALNAGAKIGQFAHNTGEGGISDYHLKHKGDLIWQIGTGYFGARDENGHFSPNAFQKNALRPEVRMIELKLSQGAKPGHGGILPGKKNTPEIAAIRGVQPFTTVYSPPFHSAFNSPRSLIQFLQQMRELSGGKPVGLKLCIGRKSEFISICKAMVELDTYPDFITVDGGEGGTGAAPPEFSNFVGMPLLDALAFVENILNGLNIRHHIKINCSGKILTGFHLVRAIALGADFCGSARAMMMALGCIQALECNRNSCPAGVATQDPTLTAGLVIGDKKVRVANYHKHTVESLVELLAAAGIDDPRKLNRHQISRRVFMNEVRTFEEIYPSVGAGVMLNGEMPERYARSFAAASSDQF